MSQFLNDPQNEVVDQLRKRYLDEYGIDTSNFSNEELIFKYGQDLEQSGLDMDGIENQHGELFKDQYYDIKNRARPDQSFGDDFGDAISSATSGLQSTALGGLGLGLGQLGFEGAEDYLLGKAAEYQEEASQSRPTIDRFSDVRWDRPEEIARFLSGAIGEVIPSTVESAAAAGIGGGVFGLGAKTLAKTAINQAIKNRVKKTVGQSVIDLGKEMAKRKALTPFSVGAGAGLTASSFGLSSGEIYTELYPYTQLDPSNPDYVDPQEARNISTGFGFIAGSLDAFGAGKILSKLTGASEKVAGGYLKTLMKSLPEGIFVEGGTEVLQELLNMTAEKYARGMEMEFNDQEISRLFDAGVLGAIGGTQFSAIGAIKGIQKKPVDEDTSMEPQNEALQRQKDMLERLSDQRAEDDSRYGIGDDVEIALSGNTGTITKISGKNVEVKLSNGDLAETTMDRLTQAVDPQEELSQPKYQELNFDETVEAVEPTEQSKWETTKVTKGGREVQTSRIKVWDDQGDPYEIEVKWYDGEFQSATEYNLSEDGERRGGVDLTKRLNKTVKDQLKAGDLSALDTLRGNQNMFTSPDGGVKREAKRQEALNKLRERQKYKEINEARFKVEESSAEKIVGGTVKDGVLPKALSGAKPRYNYGKRRIDLTFENDIAKALYIAGSKSESKRKSEYIDWLKSQGVKDVASASKQVRDSIKDQAKEGKDSVLVKSPFNKPIKPKKKLLGTEVLSLQVKDGDTRTKKDLTVTQAKDARELYDALVELSKKDMSKNIGYANKTGGFAGNVRAALISRLGQDKVKRLWTPENIQTLRDMGILNYSNEWQLGTKLDDALDQKNEEEKAQKRKNFIKREGFAQGSEIVIKETGEQTKITEITDNGMVKVDGSDNPFFPRDLKKVVAPKKPRKNKPKSNKSKPAQGPIEEVQQEIEEEVPDPIFFDDEGEIVTDVDLENANIGFSYTSGKEIKQNSLTFEGVTDIDGFIEGVKAWVSNTQNNKKRFDKRQLENLRGLEIDGVLHAVEITDDYISVAGLDIYTTERADLEARRGPVPFAINNMVTDPVRLENSIQSDSTPDGKVLTTQVFSTTRTKSAVLLRKPASKNNEEFFRLVTLSKGKTSGKTILKGYDSVSGKHIYLKEGTSNNFNEYEIVGKLESTDVVPKDLDVFFGDLDEFMADERVVQFMNREKVESKSEQKATAIAQANDLDAIEAEIIQVEAEIDDVATSDPNDPDTDKKKLELNNRVKKLREAYNKAEKANTKAQGDVDPEVVTRYQEAVDYRSELEKFRRERKKFEFDGGKKRVPTAKDIKQAEDAIEALAVRATKYNETVKTRKGVFIEDAVTENVTGNISETANVMDEQGSASNAAQASELENNPKGMRGAGKSEVVDIETASAGKDIVEFMALATKGKKNQTGAVEPGLFDIIVGDRTTLKALADLQKKYEEEKTNAEFSDEFLDSLNKFITLFYDRHAGQAFRKIRRGNKKAFDSFQEILDGAKTKKIFAQNLAVIQGRFIDVLQLADKRDLTKAISGSETDPKTVVQKPNFRSINQAKERLKDPEYFPYEIVNLALKDMGHHTESPASKAMLFPEQRDDAGNLSTQEILDHLNKDNIFDAEELLSVLQEIYGDDHYIQEDLRFLVNYGYTRNLKKLIKEGEEAPMGNVYTDPLAESRLNPNSQHIPNKVDPITGKVDMGHVLVLDEASAKASIDNARASSQSFMAPEQNPLEQTHPELVEQGKAAMNKFAPGGLGVPFPLRTALNQIKGAKSQIESIANVSRLLDSKILDGFEVVFMDWDQFRPYANPRMGVVNKAVILPGKKRIIISTAFNNNTKYSAMDTLMSDIVHEAMHMVSKPAIDLGYAYATGKQEVIESAIEEHGIPSDFNSTGEQLAKIYKDITEKLLPYLRERGRLDNHYGLTSIDEFFSELKSNPKFQKFLRETKLPSSMVKNKGLISTVLDYIFNILAKLGFKGASTSDSAMTYARNEMNKLVELSNSVSDLYDSIIHSNIRNIENLPSRLEMGFDKDKSIPNLTNDGYFETTTFISTERANPTNPGGPSKYTEVSERLQALRDQAIRIAREEARLDLLAEGDTGDPKKTGEANQTALIKLLTSPLSLIPHEAREAVIKFRESVDLVSEDKISSLTEGSATNSQAELLDALESAFENGSIDENTFITQVQAQWGNSLLGYDIKTDFESALADLREKLEEGTEIGQDSEWTFLAKGSEARAYKSSDGLIYKTFFLAPQEKDGAVNLNLPIVGSKQVSDWDLVGQNTLDTDEHPLVDKLIFDNVAGFVQTEMVAITDQGRVVYKQPDVGDVEPTPQEIQDAVLRHGHTLLEELYPNTDLDAGITAALVEKDGEKYIVADLNPRNARKLPNGEVVFIDFIARKLNPADKIKVKKKPQPTLDMDVSDDDLLGNIYTPPNDLPRGASARPDDNARVMAQANAAGFNEMIDAMVKVHRKFGEKLGIKIDKFIEDYAKPGSKSASKIKELLGKDLKPFDIDPDDIRIEDAGLNSVSRSYGVRRAIANLERVREDARKSRSSSDFLVKEIEQKQIESRRVWEDLIKGRMPSRDRLAKRIKERLNATSFDRLQEFVESMPNSGMSQADLKAVYEISESDLMDMMDAVVEARGEIDGLNKTELEQRLNSIGDSRLSGIQGDQIRQKVKRMAVVRAIKNSRDVLSLLRLSKGLIGGPEQNYKDAATMIALAEDMDALNAVKISFPGVQKTPLKHFQEMRKQEMSEVANLEKIKANMEVYDFIDRSLGDRSARLRMALGELEPVNIHDGVTLVTLERDENEPTGWKRGSYTVQIKNGKLEDRDGFIKANKDTLMGLRDEKVMSQFGNEPWWEVMNEQANLALTEPILDEHFHAQRAAWFAGLQGLTERFSKLGYEGKKLAQMSTRTVALFRDYSSKSQAYSKMFNNSYHKVMKKLKLGGNELYSGLYQDIFWWLDNHPEFAGREDEAFRSLWSHLRENANIPDKSKLDEEARRLIKDMIGKAIQARDWEAEVNKRLGNRIRDDEIKVESFVNGEMVDFYRLPLEMGYATMPRSLNDAYIRETARIMKQWDDDSGAGLLAEAASANDAETMSKIYSALFSKEVVDRFVKPYTNTDVRQSVFRGPKDEDGYSPELGNSFISEAFKASDGDIFEMSNYIYDQVAEDPTDRGKLEWQHAFLKQFFKRHAQIKKVSNRISREKNGMHSGESMRNTPQSLDSRMVESRLPKEFFFYNMYDEVSSNIRLALMTATSAFGRDGEYANRARKEGAENLDTASATFNELMSRVTKSDHKKPRATYSRQQKKEAYEELRKDGYQNPEKVWNDLYTKAIAHGELMVAFDHLGKYYGRDNIAGPYQDANLLLELLGAQSMQVLNNPKSSFWQALSLFEFPNAFRGLNKIAGKATASALGNFVNQTFGGMAEAMGVELGKTGRYAQYLNNTHFRMDEMDLSFKEYNSMVGSGGDLAETIRNRPALGLKKYIRMTKNLATHHRRKKKDGTRAPIDPLTPFTGIFPYINNVVNHSIGVGAIHTYSDLVLQIAEVIESQGYTEYREFTAKDLGMGGKLGEWVLGEEDGYNRANEMLVSAGGPTISRLAFDFVDRKKGDENALPIDKNMALLINQVAMNNVSGEGFNSKPSWLYTSPAMRYFSTFLGWPLGKMSRDLQFIFRDPNDRVRTYKALLKYIALMSAVYAPVGLSFAMLIDWYDEEMLEKPNNLPPMSPWAALPVIGIPLAMRDENFTIYSITSRLAKAGVPFGMGMDVLNGMFAKGDPYGSARELSLDSRIFAWSMFKNIYDAMGTWIHSGEFDWQMVGRPIAYGIGGNSVIQMMDLTTALMDIDSEERRVADYIGMRNYIKKTAFMMGLPLRPPSKGGQMPTGVSMNTRQMARAAFANDTEDFLAQYQEALEEAKIYIDERGMDITPEKYVADAFKGRDIRSNITARKIGDEDWAELMSLLPEDARDKIQSAINSHEHYLRLIGGSYRAPSMRTSFDRERARQRAALMLL